MGIGIRRWEGFRGLRTYQPVLQADLRELERIVQETQRVLGSVLDVDPIGGTTVINNTSITNISNATADPTGTVTLTVTPGVATTAMRSDAAPPLSQAIAPTWTGAHIWSSTGTYTPTADAVPLTINKTASLATANLLNVIDQTDSNNNLVQIDNDGQVGIRATPTALLTIGGAAIGALSESHATLYWPLDTSFGMGWQAGGAETQTTGSFTIDTWVKVGTTCNGGVIYGVNFGSYAISRLSIQSGTAFRYITHNSVVGNVAQVDAPLDFDTWYHVAVVHEKTGTTSHKLAIFLNGVLIDEDSGSDANQDWAFFGLGGDFGYGCEPGSGVSCSFPVRDTTLAGCKVRNGRFYNTTTDGAVIGTQVFTPKLPSDIPTADIFDVDLDEGSFAGSPGDITDDIHGLLDPTHTSSNPTWGTETISVGASASDLTHWCDEGASNILSRVNSTGWLGLGVDPSYSLDVIATSTLARLGYDTSNYYTTAVSSTGVVTFNAVGSGSSFVFSDAVTLSSTLTVTSTSALNGVTTITSTTSPQLLVRYDTSNHLQVSVSSAGVVTFNATGASAGFTFSDSVTLSGVNIITDTSTGTKFGTGATQKLGWWNATPVAQDTGWGSITNVTTDRAYDANSTSIDELADVLGTLIAKLVTYGILGT